LLEVLEWYYTLTVGQAHTAQATVPAASAGPGTEAVDIVKIRGGRSLQGEVIVRGAKNTLPKHLVASLLTRERGILRNVADVRDVQIMTEILRALGGSVEPLGEAALEISTASVNAGAIQTLPRFARQSRIPILLCGPLLHRFGEAVLIEPGG